MTWATLSIDRRFCGPPGSGNGGYTAGRLAALIGDPAEITLRRRGCKVRAAAGFTLTLLEHTALPKAPKFVRPAILGSATAPALIPSEPAAP